MPLKYCIDMVSLETRYTIAQQAGPPEWVSTLVNKNKPQPAPCSPGRGGRAEQARVWHELFIIASAGSV